MILQLPGRATTESRAPTTVEVPDRVLLALAQFLLDKRTGNFMINVKQGSIRGYHVNDQRELTS